MIGADILKPVVALLAWTLVMWVWLYATRLPAMSRAKIDPDSLARDPDASLDRLLPRQVQWVADNYNHLHESPTLFYAVALVLAIIGQGDGINAAIAWIYVGLRIVHSLVQAIFNKVVVRFSLFMLSMIALLALVLHAAMAVFDLV
ncbi:MAPEG family protein [Tsuneonella sp. YG55]|uniref:MAPEG family protein n=1 Tax=Tsuneonella litorea TaxID=2976475 RepID=A0A9X2W002_9SPHN|nr:MAPEG family protein [Tsuneonella litorea]MCT2558291.1 MAPEG family protein [Tsuneonella litorea]